MAPHSSFAILGADARNALRDPLLAAVLLFSLLPLALFLPLRSQIDLALAPIVNASAGSVFAEGFIVVLPALLLGWVAGMLLLEDRDEGMLTAIEASPVGKARYFGLKAILPAALAGAIGAATAILATNANFLTTIALGLLTALQAAMVTFALAAIAGNKVEGLALSKVINIAALTPLFAFAPAPVRYLAGVFPPFWTGEFLVQSPTGWAFGAVLLAAIMAHSYWLWSLYRLALRRS